MADLMVKGLTPNVSNGVSETMGADKKTNTYLAIMFLFFIVGLAMIVYAGS